MTSQHEQFWQHGSYAVIGHTARTPFPKLTYGALKALGKRVVAIDVEAASVEGDRAYRSLKELPTPVDGVVIEVPAEETQGWVEQAAELGIRRVWIHMKRETPAALAAAARAGIEVCTGTCAVQYLTTGPSVHGVHRLMRKALGRY
jgi:predicted CoA-binding protein